LMAESIDIGISTKIGGPRHVKSAAGFF